jgi:hypothetical protein
MDSAQPDYVKLGVVISTNTPSTYLVYDSLNETIPTWYSLLDIAKNQNYDDFVTYTKSHLPLEEKVISFLWFLANEDFPELIKEQTPRILSYLNGVGVRTNYDQLLQDLQGWLQADFNPQMNLDTQKYSLLQSDLDTTLQSPGLLYSALKRERVTFSAKISLQSGGTLDGLQLIDDVTVSQEVPLIVDSDVNGSLTFKAYDPPDERERLRLLDVIETISQISVRGTVYFYLSEEPKLLKLHYLNSEGNLLSEPEIAYISFNDSELEIVTNILKRNTPLILEPFTVKELTASFRLVDPELEPFDLNAGQLLVTMLSNGLLSRYLYLDETREIFLEKTRANLVYRRPFSSAPITLPKITISLAEQQSLSTQPFDVFNYEGKMTRIETSGVVYLTVVVRGPSLDILQSLQETIIPLLAYLRESMTYSAQYLQYWSGYSSGRGNLRQRHQPDVTQSKISQLSAISDIFEYNYAKKCSQVYQPDIIENPEQFEKQSFKFEGDIYHRQVLYYGRLGEKVFPFVKERDGSLLPAGTQYDSSLPVTAIGCTTKENPFIGIKEAKSARPERLKYIPCCYPEPQDTASKTLGKYLSGREITRNNAGLNKTLLRENFLAPNRTGIAPLGISKLLTQVTDYDIGFEVPKRYGVPNSPTSFLHAVLIAINDERYLATNPNQLENYITQQRLLISQKVRPEVMAQELYDLSPKERSDAVASEVYFDPRRFYRAVEEYYKVKIFLFSWPEKSEGNFQQPRSKGIYVYPRPDDSRPVILVVTHHGGTINQNSLYPQSELIVVPLPEETIKIYQPDTANLLQEFLDNCQTTVKIYVDNTDSYLNTVVNPQFNPQSLGTLTGQFLDGNGKGIGLIANGVPVYTPIFAPLLLPAVNLIPVTLEDVSDDILSQVTAVSETEPGLWIDWGSEPYQFFIPLSSYGTLQTELYPRYPFLAPNLPSKYQSEIEDLYAIQRGVKLLFQMVLYTYLIFVQETELLYTNLENLDLFWRTYVAISPSVDDYDFSLLPRELPQVASTNDLLDYWQEFTPTVIQNHLILLPNDDTSLRLNQNVQRWLQSHLGDDLVIPNFLDGYYQQEVDFKKRPFQRIFLSWDNFQQWLHQKDNSHLNIRSSIDTVNIFGNDPYLYIMSDDKGSKYFIVQNVADNRADLAVTVGVYWRETKRNAGYNVSSLPTEDLNVAITTYTVSRENQLVLKNQKLENSIYLLEYDDSRYGALLPLN